MTWKLKSLFTTLHTFNPHTREGCDCIMLSAIIMAMQLQFTHPRGVRHPHGSTDLCQINFNPHTREGCDLPLEQFVLALGTSIHTPARAATEGRSCCCALTTDFNPRTREGCDVVVPSPIRENPNFNPHTREGCDIAGRTVLGYADDFNPHTREGCDGKHIQKITAIFSEYRHQKKGNSHKKLAFLGYDSFFSCGFLPI